MARARKDVRVTYLGDHYFLRVRCPDGSTWPRHLPAEAETPAALARAEREGRRMFEEARRRGAGFVPRKMRPRDAAAVPAGESFADWFERWCKDREARGTPAKDQRGHFAKWIGPRFEGRPVASITKVDVETWVEWIDGQVRAGALSAKTASNVWGTVTKALRDASRAKTLALRVLSESPARDVAGPDGGIRRAKSYLWPAEFTALVTCERVPVRWRALFALAVYTYTRPGELEALEWEDVDLAHGVIHVHRAIDRTEPAEVKETKTNAPRRLPIEPALRPLLHYLRDRSGAVGRVIAFPPTCDLASRLRQYLGWAGITRAELFADDATRKQVTFYDLRATGITWCAFRGDEPLRIKQRAGHKDFKTTEGYIREAENLAHVIGDVFPALPESLQSDQQWDQGMAEFALLRENTWERWRPQRDSKPRQPGTAAGFPGVSSPVEPPKPADPRPPIADLRTPDPVRDPIAEALAGALEVARAEGRWADVADLARELDARQKAHAAPNVVAIDRAKRRR